MENDSNEAMAHAMLVVSDQEFSYATDWIRDAEHLMANGLYDQVSALIDPKDTDTVVDIGTGPAYQLLSLAARNGNATYIGTERTRANVIAAYENLRSQTLERFFSILAFSELAATPEKQAFWTRNLAFVRENLPQIRKNLEQKILLLDDDILHPEALPLVLGDRKIDAGILSMPGGSSSRAMEWPLETTAITEQSDLEKRVADVTNRMRTAFYHFMSEHVTTDGGRIVVAERLLLHKKITVPEATNILIGRRMGNLTKYWRPTNGCFIEADLSKTAVELGATDESGKRHSTKEKVAEGHRIGVVVCRLERTDVPFREAPLAKPVKM